MLDSLIRFQVHAMLNGLTKAYLLFFVKFKEKWALYGSKIAKESGNVSASIRDLS